MGLEKMSVVADNAHSVGNSISGFKAFLAALPIAENQTGLMLVIYAQKNANGSAARSSTMKKRQKVL